MKEKRIKSSILLLLVIILAGTGILLQSSDHLSSRIAQFLSEGQEIAKVSMGWMESELIFNESVAAQDPKLVVDAAGNVHLVWVDQANFSGAGTEDDIFYRLWNKTLRTWSPIEVVSLEHQSASFGPSFAVDLNGYVNLVWVDWTNYNGAGTDRDIFYKRRDIITGTWSPTIIISNVSGGSSSAPVIASDNEGNIHVVWHDDWNYNSSGTDLDIFYRCWNATTDTWGVTEVLSTFWGEDPVIVTDSNGTVHVVWREWTGSRYDVHYRYMNASTSVWSDPEIISTESSPNDVLFPQITVDGVGHLHVMWEWGNDIFYKQRKATTGNWTPAEIVSIESTSYSCQSALTADGDGNVYVVWSDYSEADRDIFYKYRNTTTGAWGPWELVSAKSTSESWKPTVGVDDNGYVHVAWEDKLGSSSSDYYILYTKTIILLDAPNLAPIIPNHDVDGNVTLTWSVVDNATSYYIYRDTSPFSTNTGRTPIGSTTLTNYTDTVLASGVYYYVVVAGNASGNSSISNCENVTVVLPAPDPPVLVSITPDPCFSGNITLNWNTVAGATSYYVYRNTSPINATTGLTPIHTTGTTSYLDTLTASGLYYYVVVAGNASGNSSISNCEQVVVILIDIPGFELYLGVGMLALVVLVGITRRKEGHIFSLWRS